MAKTERLYIRIDEDLKKILQQQAEKEHRTLSNYVETVLIKKLEDLKMEEKLTLQEITGQEAGIVIYPENKVIVCNWAIVCPDGAMPVLSPIGTLMCWPSNEILGVISEEYADDIRTILPGTVKSYGENEEGQEEIEFDGMDIVSDEDYDIPALWGYDFGKAFINLDDNGNLIPTEGKVYKIKTDSNDEVTIIAPEGWN